MMAPLSPHALTLPARERDRLARLGLARWPEEACGLMLGCDGRVRRLVLCRNVAARRADRYLVHARDFLRWDRAAHRLGLDILGVWHTHPDGGARPSGTDREQAWRGWSYLIAAVDGRAITELRSWRLRGDHFIEETLCLKPA
ncbi:Mov34/MPN/PAD-1 family protein [Alkalilimnicola ehrlichii MLHE-1]|uniref:Mov34/MPN/PAD-1 family protein n=1 Tax=Alkalilimnicola ehrlichii (strain ATCC BAA-1101 / DSM 17681 / MLHE-1) TaxID=187272 RepID=Q0A9H9_ALKEH|nr:Mov34/MPN/PAD-1 family protein [Alkalilimnicola ehrlichii MLHE-1]